MEVGADATVRREGKPRVGSTWGDFKRMFQSSSSEINGWFDGPRREGMRRLNTNHDLMELCVHFGADLIGLGAR